jgi:hypothetical protein
MTENGTVSAELVAERRRTRIGLCVELGLVGSILRSGRTLRGLTIKYSEVDVLVVVKTVSGEGPEVAFFGAETMGGALMKAEREISAGKARWKDDQYFA